MYLQGFSESRFPRILFICLPCHEINSEPNLTFEIANENRMCDFLTIKMSLFVLICSAYDVVLKTFWKWFILLAKLSIDVDLNF